MHEKQLTRRKFLMLTTAGLGFAFLDSCGDGPTIPTTKGIPSSQSSCGLLQTLSDNIIPEGLGINIHFTKPNQNDIDMIASAGFGFVRMDFPWSDIERQKGIYDFSQQENLIKILANRGIRALAILAYGNQLYDNSTPPFHLGPQTDEVRQAFARFAASAAERFNKFDVVWEIWNEPNNSDFWKPKPNADEYVKLAKGTIEAIRKANSCATIVAPAVITSFPNRNFDAWTFLERCFELDLLEQKIDAISVHLYRNQPPEEVVNDYNRLSDLFSRYKRKDGKILPIISSEWGYPVTAGVSKEFQAALLVREFLINIIKGVPLSIWYDWQDDGKDPNNLDDNFGILTWDHQPKPTYFATQTLIKQLSGFHFKNRLSIPQLTTQDFALLFMHENVKKIVLWTTGVPHTIQLKIDQTYTTIISVTGEKQSVTPTNGTLKMKLTGSPQYLST